MDPATLVSVGAAVAGQAVSMAHQFLPDVSEMVKADAGQHSTFVAAVRAGQLTTVLGVAAVAGTAAAMTHSAQPLLIGAASVALMLLAYEYLLRKQPEGSNP
jgi:hypothetical protein